MFETLISIIPTLVELLRSVFKKKRKVRGCVVSCWSCSRIVKLEDAFTFEEYDHTGVTMIRQQHFCKSCAAKIASSKK